MSNRQIGCAFALFLAATPLLLLFFMGQTQFRILRARIRGIIRSGPD